MSAPELVAEVKWCDAPVTLWRWPDTGLSVLLARTKGPVTHAFFVIATEAHDDDGLPHTLEHLIFLGSKQYPYKGACSQCAPPDLHGHVLTASPFPGVLDTAANRLYARGTNAWTATDHTCYTASHAGADGLLALLPLYADHVLFPTITEAGYTTEVHHVNGEGQDAGVVYCEMQARENTSYSVTSYELHQLCFPESGYRSETGGRMRELRDSCNHAKVAAYHRQCYRPSGVRLVVVGDIPQERLLATCEAIQANIRAQGLDHWPQDAPRCWAKPAAGLCESVTKRVAFPSDDAETGIVRVGWLTFNVGDQYQRSAMEALLTYLTDTSVAELQQAFIECQPPLAGAVYASADDYDPQMVRAARASRDVCRPDCVPCGSAFQVTITLDSVPTDKLDVICDKLQAALAAFGASDGAALDVSRMKSVLHRRRLDILDGAESSPENSVTAAAIPAFLYARSGDDGDALRVALGELARVDAMEGEPPAFWTALCHTALASAHRACVIGTPSPQLGKEMAAAEDARVEARKAALGPDGLQRLHDALEEAKKVNETPAPASMMDAFPVPSVDAIATHAVVTLRSAITPIAAGEPPLALPPAELQAVASQVAALAVPAQFDDVATDFVDVTLCVRTDGLAPALLGLLPTLCAAQFECPVQRGDTLVPHTQVIAELAAATTQTGASLGFGGGRFSLGAFGAGCIVLSARCERAKYGATVALLCDCLLRGQVTADRLRILVQKALNAVPRTSRDGNACCTALLRDRMCSPASAAHAVLFPEQQRLLTRLLARLDAQPGDVCAEFAALRAQLLSHPSRVLVHVGAALAQLGDVTAVWESHLLPGLAAAASSAGGSQLEGRITLSATCLAPDIASGGWARVVANGAVESGYLTASSAGPSHWEHPDVAPLTVAIELLTQLEGPFWKELRGLGLSYSYNISMSPEEGRLYFSLFKAGHIGNATAAATAIVARYAADDGSQSLFDERSVETACSSAVFAAINRERTPASAARSGLMSYLRAVPPAGATRRMLAALRAVTPQSARQALRTYLVPLFDPSRTVTAACCNPNKVEELLRDAPHYRFTAAMSLEEAFPGGEGPLCLTATAKVGTDCAKCECPRCVPQPGKGPFTLPSSS